MIKLIRFIAFVVAMVSMWSVYSRPEVREALFMAIDTESSYYEDDYDDYDYEEDEGGYEDPDYYDEY